METDLPELKRLAQAMKTRILDVSTLTFMYAEATRPDVILDLIEQLEAAKKTINNLVILVGQRDADRAKLRNLLGEAADSMRHTPACAVTYPPTSSQCDCGMADLLARLDRASAGGKP